MREEHRRGMRDEGWGPSPRPGGPEWGPGPGRGPGRRGGERGGPGWGGPGGHGHHGPRGEFGARWAGVFGPEFVLRGPGFGPRGPGGRGMRVRKGDVRAAVLDLLAEGGQWNGYQLIQEIAGRTSGVWRPSAGSVYPTLQQLEDEGLIAPEGEGRRRMYSLTDAGREYADEHADELGASWDAAADMTDGDDFEFHDLIRQVMMAVMQVRRAGSAEQVAQARDVLAQARRSLYRILAEDPADSAPQTDSAPQAGTPTADGPQDTE